MLEQMKKMIEQVISSSALQALKALTTQSLKMPMTNAAARVPIWGIFISIFIALPIDLLICLLCFFAYVFFLFFVVKLLIVTFFKQLK